MSRVGRALKGTAVQQLFELVAMLLSVLLVPLYLLKLGQEGYGLYLTGVVWAGYLGFGNAGLSAATLILVGQAGGSADDVSRIVGTSRTLTLLTSGMVALVSLGMFALLREPAAAGALKLTHPDAPVLALVVGAQVCVSIVGGPFFDLLYGLQQAPVAALIQGAARLSIQLVSMVLLFAGASVWQVFVATPACFALSAIVAYGVVRRRHRSALARGFEWNPSQAKAQLRAGAKSLGLQVGATLSSTAPVFALTGWGGSALVPLYVVPLRILTVVSGVLSTFTAMFQGAVGEAWAKRELGWLTENTRGVLRHSLLLFAGIAAVMFAIGPEVVAVWTRGGLSVGLLAISGAVAAAILLSLTASLRFLLSAINRHRTAAIAELIGGAVSFALCAVAVRLNPAAVGFGFALAALVTSFWVMLRELRRFFETDRLLPSLKEGAALLAIFAVTWAVCAGTAQLCQSAAFPPWATIAVAAAFGGLSFLACCQLFRAVDVVRLLKARLRPSEPVVGLEAREPQRGAREDANRVGGPSR